MYYLLSFLPVIINVIFNLLGIFNFLPTEHFKNNYYDLWKIIRVILLYFTPILTPLYLTALHITFTKFSKEHKIKRYISVIMVPAIPLLSALINYIFTSNPDGFTIVILEVMVFFAVLIGYLGIGIFELICWIVRYQKQKNSDKRYKRKFHENN